MASQLAANSALSDEERAALGAKLRQLEARLAAAAARGNGGRARGSERR